MFLPALGLTMVVSANYYFFLDWGEEAYIRSLDFKDDSILASLMWLLYVLGIYWVLAVFYI